MYLRRVVLCFQRNQLSGTIPAELGTANMPVLSVLRLQRNSISGSIGTTLPELPIIEVCNFGAFSITASLPHCLPTSLSLYLTVSLPHCLSTSLSLYLTASLPHYHSTSLSLYLTVSLPHCLPTSLSPYLTVSLPHCLSTSLSLYLMVNRFSLSDSICRRAFWLNLSPCLSSINHPRM